MDAAGSSRWPSWRGRVSLTLRLDRSGGAGQVAVEQATTIGWERYVGLTGAKIGMHSFGASAPLKALLGKFGFTPEKVAEVARQQIARKPGKAET